MTIMLLDQEIHLGLKKKLRIGHQISQWLLYVT